MAGPTFTLSTSGTDPKNATKEDLESDVQAVVDALQDSIDAKADEAATTAALESKADGSGLTNVDNTADADKPVSDATQMALDEKADASATAAALASKADDAETTAALESKADSAATTAALADKADQTATTDALAGEAGIEAITKQSSRAEMSSAFSAATTGSDRAEIAVGTPAVNDDLGAVWQLNGSDAVDGFQDIAPRKEIAIEAGRIYRARFSLARIVDPVDPSGHSIEVRLRSLNKSRGGVSNVVVSDLGSIVVADGVVDYEFRFSSAEGQDRKTPATARYALPHLRVYGADHATDIAVIDVQDITDTAGLSGVALSGDADDLADGSTKVVMTTGERTKLSGVASGATANDSDANLKDRTKHTGVMPNAGLGEKSITGVKYKDGSVGGDALANSGVTTEKLANNSVTLEKMAGVAQSSFLGRASGTGSGNPTVFSTNEARGELGVDILDLSARRDSGVVLDYRADRGAIRTTAKFIAKGATALGTFERTGAAWGMVSGGQAVSVAENAPITMFDDKGRALGVYFGAANADAADIDLSNWTTSTYGTIIPGQTGPSGLDDAFLLREDSGGNATHTGQETSLDYVSGEAETWHVWAKDAGRHLKISTVNTNSTEVSATFNLRSGKLMASEGLDIAWKPIKARNGYYLCAITFTPDQTGSNGQLKFLLVDDFGNTQYTGDDASGVYLALPARERGVNLSAPGVAGARGADAHYIVDDDIDHSLTEGTMICCAGRSAGVADQSHTIAAIVSSAAGGIEIQNYGADGLAVYFSDGSSTSTIYANNLFSVDDRMAQADIAVTWTAEQGELWVDGVCQGVVSNPPLPGNIARFQTGGHYGSNQWGGIIAKAEYYPVVMSPADLGGHAPMPALSATGEPGNRCMVVDDLFEIATLGDNYAPWVNAETREFGWTRKWHGVVYDECFPVDFRHTIDKDVTKMAVALRIGDGLTTGQNSVPVLNATPIAAGRAVTAGTGPRVSSSIADTTALTTHREITDVMDLVETNDLAHGDTGAGFSAQQYFDMVSDTSVGFFTANGGAKSATIGENLVAGALNLERAYARMLWVAYRKGLQLEPPALMYAGGNIDTDDRAAHLADLQALHDEIAMPLGEMARTWQSQVQGKDLLPGALFISQIARSTRAQNALAQWDATLDETRNIIGVTPTGMLETSGDAYTADNSKGVSGEDAYLSPAAMGWRGAIEGKVLYEWQTLQSPEWFRPVIAGRTGVLITVDFNGLNDTVKQFNTALDDADMGAFVDGTYGIRFVDDGDGNNVSIVGVAINSGWQLEITLDGEPTGSNPRIEFGTQADVAGQGPGKGLRVGIRDNTSTTVIVDGESKSLSKHAPVSSLPLGNPLASANRMLVISADDLSFANAQSGPFSTVTPNLDALTATSRVYQSCMASMPVCEASRASFLSGMDVPQTGVLDNGHDWRERVGRDKLLFAWLKSQGVDSAVCGKVLHTPKMKAYERETVSVYEAPLGWSITPPNEDNIVIHAQVGGTYWGEWTGPESDLQDYNTAAFGVRHANFNGVLFLGFVRPHSSNLVPSYYIEQQISEAEIQAILDDPSVFPPDDRDDLPDPALGLADTTSYDSLVAAGTLAKAIRCNLAAIMYMDVQLGKVLDAVASVDPDKKIMFFPDHGLNGGEKSHMGKLTLWESACNATLFYKDGSVATVTEPVSLLDVAPTICDAVGVPRAPWHIGKNLVTEAAGADGETPVEFSWVNGALGIRTSTHRLIIYVEADAMELYDVIADPSNHTNLLHEANINATHEATRDSILDIAEPRLRSRGYQVDTGRFQESVNSILQVGQDLIGTAGDDILIGSAISGGDGDDTLYSLGSGTVPDDVEHAELIGAGTLTGSASDDDLRADDAGPGVLIGVAGDDTLTGNDADDTLIGGAGDDTLIARGGSDTLTGGAGIDTFIIEKGAGTTTITDMGGNDVIVLRGWDTDETVSRVYAGGDTTLTIDGQQVVCDGADVPLTQVRVEPES